MAVESEKYRAQFDPMDPNKVVKAAFDIARSPATRLPKPKSNKKKKSDEIPYAVMTLPESDSPVDLDKVNMKQLGLSTTNQYTLVIVPGKSNPTTNYVSATMGKTWDFMRSHIGALVIVASIGFILEDPYTSMSDKSLLLEGDGFAFGATSLGMLIAHLGQGQKSKTAAKISYNVGQSVLFTCTLITVSKIIAAALKSYCETMEPSMAGAISYILARGLTTTLIRADSQFIKDLFGEENLTKYLDWEKGGGLREAVAKALLIGVAIKFTTLAAPAAIAYIASQSAIDIYYKGEFENGKQYLQILQENLDVICQRTVEATTSIIVAPLAPLVAQSFLGQTIFQSTCAVAVGAITKPMIEKIPKYKDSHAESITEERDNALDTAIPDLPPS